MTHETVYAEIDREIRGLIETYRKPIFHRLPEEEQQKLRDRITELQDRSDQLRKIVQPF